MHSMLSLQLRRVSSRPKSLASYSSMWLLYSESLFMNGIGIRNKSTASSPRMIYRARSVLTGRTTTCTGCTMTVKTTANHQKPLKPLVSTCEEKWHASNTYVHPQTLNLKFVLPVPS